MAQKRALFISCGIFREELEYLLREKKLEGEFIFLDAALHVNFDRLKAELEAALEAHKDCGPRVLYGHCHPEMREIMDRHRVRKIRAGNCLEAMLGSEELKRLSSEAKTFFLTAGWINNWEAMFDLGRRDFNFDFRAMFSSYRRILVLDAGVIPLDESKVQAFSEFTGLPVERMPITLDHLLKLVRDA